MAPQVRQFHYQGGWPKKRQWAMNTLPIAYDWIMLLDADEVLTPELGAGNSCSDPESGDRWIFHPAAYMVPGSSFTSRRCALWKLSLCFAGGKGRYECRLKDQDASMADMEVHEHVVVEGATARLRNPLIHHDVESLSRYIRKHDEYSNWESRVLLQRGGDQELPPSLFGTQAQRRRWLKLKLFGMPGSPVLLFLYRYVLRFGFLDAVPGLIYCGFQAVQMFHTKSKIYELNSRETEVKKNESQEKPKLR